MNTSVFKKAVLSFVILLVGLALVISPVLAVQVGNDEVNYVGVRYDFPTVGESTWFYQVISGSAPAISHVTFELNLVCLQVVDAGTWDGTDMDTLTSGGGAPVIGTDPTTGITGIKFDESFADGETRYYYFTVNGNYAADDMVTVASKGGPGFDTALITGPSGTCAPVANPSIDIEKFVNGEDADEAPGVEIIEGDAISFDFVVTNTGNVALSDVSVTDDVFGAICGFGSLGVGESGTCSIGGLTAVVGQHTNVGTVTGTYNNATVTDSDPANYFGTPRFIPNPLIDIEKFVNGEDADEAPGVELLVGAAVSFDFVVTNTGNVALSDVTVTDDVFGAICGFGSLGVGESGTCTISGLTAVEGQHTNIGTATGSYMNSTVSDSDPANYFGKPPFTPKPGLDIIKLTNGIDVTEAPGPSLPVGSVVTWTYIVTNTGNVTLENIMVADNMIGKICIIATLEPGQTVTCTASGTVVEGQYMNIGKAGTWYGGTSKTGGIKVTDADNSYYTGVK